MRTTSRAAPTTRRKRTHSGGNGRKGACSLSNLSASYGEGGRLTLTEANNYATTLLSLKRFKEARKLLRKTIPVARRVLGESHDLTLKMRWCYARALYENTGATLDDLREAVSTLEDAERIARRVLGGAHPVTVGIGDALGNARAALRARETPSSSP